MIDLGAGRHLDVVLAAWNVGTLSAVLVPAWLAGQRIRRR